MSGEIQLLVMVKKKSLWCKRGRIGGAMSFNRLGDVVTTL